VGGGVWFFLSVMGYEGGVVLVVCGGVCGGSQLVLFCGWLVFSGLWGLCHTVQVGEGRIVVGWRLGTCAGVGCLAGARLEGGVGCGRR